MHDPIHSPQHYTAGGVECIDALLAAAGPEAHIDHCVQTAIAYLWRWRRKDGRQDLAKAAWYINRAIETHHTITHHKDHGPADT